MKHILCQPLPAARICSAAYTDLVHLGHLTCSTGLNGIFGSGLVDVVWWSRCGGKEGKDLDDWLVG